jgi:hypothetical protein
MAEVADTLMASRAIVFDTLRTLFFDTDTVEFLKPTTDATRDFDNVDYLDTGWLLKYNNFRNNFLLEVAGPSAWMQTVMETATHIKIDDDIYVISRKDTIPPKGMDVTWKVYCERFTKRTQFGAIY